ncbi:hypothetical protein ACVWZL_004782 [Bradyrhizobium sp. GM2.4]
MQPRGKIVVASQHYPPDPSTTAAIMAEIAWTCANTSGPRVVGLPWRVARASQMGAVKPRILKVKKRMARKSALVRRAVAKFLFASRPSSR